MIEVPLTSSAAQSIAIVIDEQNYTCLVTFNSRNETWSISFSQNGVDIVTGVYMLGGIDILQQHSIDIKNAYVVNLENTQSDPTRDDFGIIAKLFILTDDEVEASGSTI